MTTDKPILTRATWFLLGFITGALVHPCTMLIVESRSRPEPTEGP